MEAVGAARCWRRHHSAARPRQVARARRGRARCSASSSASDGASPGDDEVDSAKSSDDPSYSSSSSSSPSSSMDGASLASEFMKIAAERARKEELAMATRWKQGGLRPRVVHENASEFLRRVDLRFPLAVFGTASGAVLVADCTELGGLEYRERATRLLASCPDAHARDWNAAEDRGLGERSLLGLYDGGAVTAVAVDAFEFKSLNDSSSDVTNESSTSINVVCSGGRDGVLNAWVVPEDADVDDMARRKAPVAGAALQKHGAATHPNVVTSIATHPATNAVWTSCLDGVVRKWTLVDGEAPNALRIAREHDVGQPALCVSIRRVLRPHRPPYDRVGVVNAVS